MKKNSTKIITIIYIDGFASKPHNSFCHKTVLSPYTVDMITLHSVSKFYQDQSIEFC